MSGTIEFSLPNNGDLVIGQSFLFTVTVSCDKDIDDKITISFYNSKNITVPSDDILLILKDNRKKAMVTVTLVVFNSLSENEEIYFSVKTSLNDIQPKTLKYTAKTINSNSLELNIDTVSLVMPESFNDSQIGAISTKVHTVLRDKKGVVLSGVPVFIKSNIIDQLEEVCIYSDDGNLIINIQKFGIYYGFFVNSDNKGKVKFFITPRKSLPLVIEFFSIIPNSTDFVSSKNPIFITVDDIQDNRQPLNIITAIDGNLKSEGESKFWVDMSPCEDYKLGDFLFFFVNKEYKYYTRILDADKLSSCLRELSYFIFKQNELSKLNYILIQSDGHVLVKSSPTDVTYRGRPNKPWKDVDRIYEPCKVYSSFDKLIKQGEGINNNKISNHIHNSNDAGLFVRITGTNDNSDATKIKLGSKIILTLYINSNTQTINHVFNGNMPYQPDSVGGKTATLKFDIPYNLLNNNLAFPYHDGEIFFDYQIGDDNERDMTYGGIWSGHIVTF